MKRKTILLFILLVLIIVVFSVKSKITNDKIIYDIADIKTYKYLKYKDKSGFGVIDRDGNVIIESRYKNIEIPNPEKDIFICYNDDENSKVLNSKNDVLFSKFDAIEAIKLKNVASTLCYEKSVLKYKKDGKYGLMDFNGKIITKNVYSSIENLQSTEGKFKVEKNNKFGVINLNGLVLVKCEFDEIVTDGFFSEDNKYIEAGFIVSNTTNDGYRYGYINYEGKKYLKTEYNEIIRVNNQKDIYLIISKNGKYGLYKNNKQIIKPEYNSIIYTDNGALIIEKNKQYGIANFKGEIKVDTKYLSIEENGIYLYAQGVKNNDVFDTQGNQKDINVGKSVYETENENYRISTIINNGIIYYGIEDKLGNILVENNYNYIEYAFEDYFIVQDKKEKYGVINSKDRKILDIKYDLIQKIKNKNIIQVSDVKNKKTMFFSSKLEEVVSCKNAIVQNENNYIRVYNQKEEFYLDSNGNKIEKSSKIVEDDLKRKLPEKIKEYKKQQISLDDAYYEK